MMDHEMYLLMNHNHASYERAGCPVVFGDQGKVRAYTQDPPAQVKNSLSRVLSTLRRAVGERIRSTPIISSRA